MPDEADVKDTVAADAGAAAAAAADKGGANKGGADTGAADKGGADKGAQDKGGAAEKGAADTVLDGDKGGDKPVTTPANWPANWQEMLAGDDKEALKTLGRFTDPTALWKSYQAMRQKMDSGELKAPLAKDAKPEEVAAWRKANGIPEAPDKYEIKLADGLVIGEPDKPLVDNYLAAAHALNHTPEQVNANLNWYFQAVRQQEELVAEANQTARTACEEELRAEWGTDYRLTLNGVHSLLDGAPKGVKEAMLSAKAADGTNMMNQPGVMRWLAQTARELNPIASVVGVGGNASAQGIEDEIAQIEGVMKTDRAKYNGDEKMQERLRKLYGARERLGSKAA